MTKFVSGLSVPDSGGPFYRPAGFNNTRIPEKTKHIKTLNNFIPSLREIKRARLFYMQAATALPLIYRNNNDD
jgi:hypothetical protein